jgi:hypothetical protein
MPAGPDLGTARQKLMEDFGVSRQVAGWQIKNGSGWGLLNPAERRMVDTWCRPEFSQDR